METSRAGDAIQEARINYEKDTEEKHIGTVAVRGGLLLDLEYFRLRRPLAWGPKTNIAHVIIDWSSTVAVKIIETCGPSVEERQKYIPYDYHAWKYRRPLT
jgi:hypothetical protein